MDTAGIVTALVSGGTITYTFSWFKNKADLEGARLRNINSAIAIYKDVQTELQEHNSDLRKQHLELKHELEILSSKCSQLSAEIDNLRKENISLKSEIKLLNERLQKTDNEK